MRILMAHNRYLMPGGEDQSTLAEAAMLQTGGHEVDLWQVSNDAVAGVAETLKAGVRAVWSRRAAYELRIRLRAKRYDVLHVQNFFPQLSPVVHRVAAAEGVATVQHLRNFRLMCVNSTFFRAGKDCRDCAASPLPWRGVVRGCYRGSRLASAAPALMVGVHKALGTFAEAIDAYVAISRHVRDSFAASGLPLGRIHVRDNTLAQPPASPCAERLPRIVAPGRLTPEKGFDVLIAAWKQTPRPGASLVIAGTGPDEARLKALAGDDPSIRFAGQLAFADLREEMAGACAVVNAALWSEPFGRTPMEAFSVGTPAVVSRIGGLAEIVTQERDGLLVPPGDAAALSEAMTAMLRQGERHAAMCAAAAQTFAARFQPSVILPQTEAIYRAAIERRRHAALGTPVALPA